MYALLAQVPPVEPNQNFFGANLATQWMNGIAFLAIVMVVIGLVLSAGLWAVGAFSNNYTQSVNGKKGFLICAAAAVAIGAASAAVQYFYTAGSGLDNNQAANINFKDRA